MKLYKQYLKSIRIIYGQVFKEPGDLVFTTSFLGSLFLIFQVAFFYEIISQILASDLPTPNNATGVVVALFALTMFNYFLIKKKVVLLEVEVSRSTSILVFIYLMVTSIITYLSYILVHPT